MKILVWQWGRHGSAPRLAALLAGALRACPETDAVLSLAAGAELLHTADAPTNDLPMQTYRSAAGFAARFALAPVLARRLTQQLAPLGLDLAICMQPGPLDLVMAAALRRLGVKFAVVVHDADLHPGDGLPLQMVLQRRLCRQADALMALSDHVATRLHAQGLGSQGLGSQGLGSLGLGSGAAGVRPILHGFHPPLPFGPALRPAARAPGPPRPLFFGRLLPYKGLDLLAAALAKLGAAPGCAVRVVGSGPDSAALAALRALPWVTVENRWVPEAEVPTLLAWSDALVLPYREASQSGVAAAALAFGRRVLATRVGGLAEQLGAEPLAELCAPDVDSLTGAIARLIAAPLTMGTAVDPAAAWRRLAGLLLDGMHPLLGAAH